MGDLLGDVTGIIDFDFTDRKLFVTAMEPGGFVNGGIPVQETTLLGDDSRALTVATFNVENLDPTDGAARFTALANAMANNLNAPDIICIEEMQDNNGATASGGADASLTWQMLVDALNLATGSNYQWVDQEPVAGAEGGEPGGNIRVGFLYNTDRVQLGGLDANATLAERRMYTDRIGDGVRDAGDLIAFSDNMLGAEINTVDWTTTRRSLLGEFTFHGNTVYVTANHWPAKGGSGDFWQFNQNLGAGEPDNSDWAQRNQVAQDVYSMMNLIQSTNANAGIVAGGDFNDFYFYRPLTTVTGYTLADGSVRVGGARFDNLTLTLAEAERYTYTFDGRSQAIDHVIANGLLSGIATYDIVHLNTGYNSNGTGPNANPALSDHDPALSSFDYRSLGELLIGTSGNDLIEGFGGNDILIGGAGSDRLVGGAGDDVFRAETADDVIEEAVGGGTDAVYAAVSYTLGAGQEIEMLSAIIPSSSAALNLTGNEFGQTIIGTAGSNELIGAGGGDVMAGGLGNDFYRIENAGDFILESVGGGTDAAYVALALSGYTLNAGAEVELLSAIVPSSTVAFDLTGNEFGQTIIGTAGVNVLIGGGGDDVLAGGAGNDLYRVEDAGDVVVENAGGGSDAVYAVVSYTLPSAYEIEVLAAISRTSTAALNLTGNGYSNTIFGSDGANVIDGKGGNDALVGYGGADVFAFTTALGVGNVDAVFGFIAGTDKIGLDDAVFGDIGTPGAFNANAFVVGSAAADADDRIVYNQVTGQLFYDADGNGGGAAILFATLQGAPALTVSDFQVI
jgi:Ca2+-binding RTX toxin-like protein